MRLLRGSYKAVHLAHLAVPGIREASVNDSSSCYFNYSRSNSLSSRAPWGILSRKQSTEIGNMVEIMLRNSQRQVPTGTPDTDKKLELSEQIFSPGRTPVLREG